MNDVAAAVLVAIVSFIVIGEVLFQRSEARRRHQSKLAQELDEEAPWSDAARDAEEVW